MMFQELRHRSEFKKKNMVVRVADYACFFIQNFSGGVSEANTAESTEIGVLYEFIGIFNGLIYG